jgi:hypothetical protein
VPAELPAAEAAAAALRVALALAPRAALIAAFAAYFFLVIPLVVAATHHVVMNTTSSMRPPELEGVLETQMLWIRARLLGGWAPLAADWAAGVAMLLPFFLYDVAIRAISSLVTIANEREVQRILLWRLEGTGMDRWFP